MLALSVSISTISWPFSTSSPSETIHFRIVPSSIESERRGMVTSVAMASPQRPATGGPAGLKQDRALLQRVGEARQGDVGGHGLPLEIAERGDGCLHDVLLVRERGLL